MVIKTVLIHFLVATNLCFEPNNLWLYWISHGFRKYGPACHEKNI